MAQWRDSEENLPTGYSSEPSSRGGRHNPSARSNMASRSSAAGSRHMSPSPLHTSSLPQAYINEDSPSSQSPLSSRTSANASPAQNRSPISRIANATFPAPPSTSASMSPDIASSSAADTNTQHSTGNASNQPGVREVDRSTSSSVSSIVSAPGERPSHRYMPRTSSIDSAISSLSSAPHKSTFDPSTLTPADISNLINTAGSAEAVIVHLLKEKHQAASQNAQLWKLVDKQRTLVLGLNKDLERAFKEKEKYKRKLKELQDSAPPLPLADPSVPRALLTQPDVLRTSQPTLGTDTGYKQSSVGPSSQPLENVSSLTSATDVSSSVVGNDLQKLSQQSRKAPPAPLNLRPGEPQTQIKAPELGSDEDGTATDGSARGRRKTRDEDDRDREASQKDVENHAQGVRDTAASADPALTSWEAAARSPTTAEATGSLGSILNSRAQPPALNGRQSVPMPKSPGLPFSPRPEDRPIGSPLPRMPRDTVAGFTSSGMPLSPGAENYPPSFPRSTAPIPTIDPAVQIDSPRTPGFSGTSIHQGLVSEDYPGLLLPPNALPLIQVRVSSSRLRPSRVSYMVSKPLDEEPVFTLSVIARSDMIELWRVEKVIASLPQLDSQVRQLVSFAGKLPDRSIFSGHSPAKVDARRAALNAYFDSLLDTPMNEKAGLVVCQFLTHDAIEPRDDETSLLKGNGQVKSDVLQSTEGKTRKEGYLTKKGKNFGGWKARYFVLQGPELKYFESPNGPHMGTIRLHHAQIGKQSQNPSSQSQSPPGGDEDSDNQYRHAFLILEPKKKDSSALVRHVLCAESDEERDSWVEALMEYVEGASSDTESRGTASARRQSVAQNKSQPSAAAPKSKLFPNTGSKRSGRGLESPEQDLVPSVQGLSFDDTIAAEPPILGSTLEQAPRSPRVPAALSMDFRDSNQNPAEPPLQSPKIISGPTNGAVIQDVGAWGNKPTTTTSTKEKKRSIWGFRTRSSFDLAAQAQADVNANTGSTQTEPKEPVRPVFGIPLAEAVQCCAPQNVDVELPAVVYRCIEYLHAKNAASEEGIFRLSGSNVVIKALKERFNTEGDVDFLAGDQYYDVHAVASLFKQYLRELPTTVLTRELHLDFLRVLEFEDRQRKVVAFNSLVHQLPRPNLALLRALSLYLIEIVNNADVNKMTVRNVGIVFAPTLNIPAPVFSMFLTDFESIFGDAPNPNSAATELAVDNSLSQGDIRSPRHQMFSDISTPSYNQTSFRGTGDVQAGFTDHTRPTHDTGFVPMPPGYDQPPKRQDPYHQHPGSSGSYSSLNGMLVPNAGDTRSAKTKRRESSMLYMEPNSEE